MPSAATCLTQMFPIVSQKAPKSDVIFQLHASFIWPHSFLQRNPGVDPLINPLDYVLGIPGSSDEIHHDNTAAPPERHSHRLKRSHRRHRMRHHDVPSNL